MRTVLGEQPGLWIARNEQHGRRWRLLVGVMRERAAFRDVYGDLGVPRWRR